MLMILYSIIQDLLLLILKIIYKKNIDKFINWCVVNKLTINIKKTKVMIFGSRYNIKKNNMIELTIN